jgi:uncharacterized protein
MAVGDRDPRAYAAAWRERAVARAREQAQRRERLREGLPAVVRLLVERFGVTRVVLFGSLARDEAGPDSDVDLLVEGLAPDELFAATAEADRMLGEAHVDLVPRTMARPAVLERAAAEGVVLHG